MEVCRLCLDLLQDNAFSKLRDPYKCIINNVIPEVDLDISTDPVICNQCLSSVDELHKFKLICFETQQQLKQKTKELGDLNLTVREILQGTSIKGAVITDKTKERICRTCLESIEGESFTILKPSNPDAYLDSMLTTCLPEVDLEISRDPVMCAKCLSCLQKFHNLKTACLDVEEKLNNYNINHGTNLKSPINLHSVLEALQDSKKDSPSFVSITDVKSEKMDNINDKEIQAANVEKEEKMDIKLEESKTKKLEGNGVDHKVKVYACAFCNAEFSSRRALKEHRKAHAGQVKTFNCERCPSRFTIESEYYSHIKFGHGLVERPFTCEVCYSTFTTNIGMVRHMQRLHSENKELPHVCSYCGKRFLLAYSLKQHVMAHTGERPFKCDYCGKTFTLRPLLIHHIRFHTGERPYACDECAKTFVSANLLSMHKKSQHLIKFLDTSTTETTLGETKSSQALLGEVHCDLCGKCFSSIWSLQRHKLAHTGEKRFECYECHARYSQKSIMDKHIRSRHTGEKPFRCDLCPKAFTAKSNLNSHYKTHQGIRPYICDICGHHFSQKSNLKKHLTGHSGERRFPCDVCHKMFASKYNLQSHMEVHNGEKPYLCDLCSETFRHITPLKVHRMTHFGKSPYTCGACGMQFMHHSGLISHEKTHLGDKPFECPICGKRFVKESIVASHITLHTGEKPFECFICKRKYADKSKLNYHLKKKCLKGVSLSIKVR